VLIAFIATLLCQFVFLPFSLLPGLSALIFYYIGYLVKKWQILEKRIPVLMQCIMGIIWVYCIIYGHLEISLCRYDCYPIDILGAISGCYFVHMICKYVSNRNLFFKDILLLLGKLSLVILCFHNIEFFIIPWEVLINRLFDLVDISLNRYIVAVLIIICRLVWALAIAFFIPKIAVFRRIFSIN
jgi:hypothetical protein